jgi:hypothetical protein
MRTPPSKTHNLFLEALLTSLANQADRCAS